MEKEVRICDLCDKIRVATCECKLCGKDLCSGHNDPFQVQFIEDRQRGIGKWHCVNIPLCYECKRVVMEEIYIFQSELGDRLRKVAEKFLKEMYCG